MLMVGLLFVAVQLDSVQTFLARRLTAYFSGELNTNVSIDKVSIRFIKSVVLKGFYVEDLHGDTLIYAKELNIAIEDLSTEKRSLLIDRITLDKAVFNLKHYRGEPHDNLHFITEYFSSSDTSSGGAPWKIKFKELSLKDVTFREKVEDDTSTTAGVNFSDLMVTGINGEFRNFSTQDDSIFVDIQSLRFKEKSGFSINEFSANVKFSPTELRLKKLHISSPNTLIETDLTFQYDSLPCFDYFTSQIKWQSEFKRSSVSFADIAFFAPELFGIDKAVAIEGNFKGSVNNFKGKNVYLGWGSHSGFKGNIFMNGLPKIEETYMEVTAERINTDKQDIEWIPLAPFTEKKHIVLPENLQDLGNVIFKGRFTGFYSDFVAFGNVNTGIGSISSDINLKYDKTSESTVYSGHLTATKFDLGKIAMVNDLGNVTFSVNVKGSGLRLDNINAKLTGKIDQLVYKNYSYHSLLVDGQIAKKLFNGSLSANEENLDFDFEGSVDYRGKLPEFHFKSDIRTARLDSLNLFKTKEKTILQTTIRTHFVGNNLDNITGGLEIENTNFLTGMKLFHINSITVKADKSAEHRTIDIESDNVDAHFKGQFELAKIGDAIKEILPHYLPSVILPQKSVFSNQNFTYDIRLKNLNVFTETVIPSWQFAPNTTLSGHFNSLQNDLELDISAEWVHFNKFSIDDIDVHTVFDNSKIDLDAKAFRISKNEENFIMSPQIKAVAENNKVVYDLRLADVDTLSNRLFMKGVFDFFSASRFNMKIDSSELVIENKPWLIDSRNNFLFDTTGIQISNLNFSRLNESLNIDGIVSKKISDHLGVHLSGFDINHLNSLLNSKKSVFGGVVNGDISVSGLLGDLQLESDIKIQNLTIDNDTLGHASISSKYNSEQKVIVSNISIIKGIAKIVDINGSYFLSRDENNLDFNIKLSNVYLHPLERYIDDIMRELYGKVSADLKLTGSLEKPEFNGTVELNKVSLIVDYLNTRYSLSTSVEVKKNEFIINGLKIFDVNNNEALANGKIYHDYFRNFRFDISLEAKKFQVLNTTLKNNILYYGVANATGYAHFFGPLQNMNMDISLSPDKGTVLNIPLNTREDFSRYGFITFIDRTKDTTQTITRGQVDLSGVRLNLKLDLNRNANINIIFDEKIGDVISGSGTGSLRLDINSAGNFNMYGTYSIEKGEYLFTLQNLINKRFIIEPGSYITWAGDPYEAIVDLSAVYVVYTSSLHNIISTGDSTAFKGRYPVDCRLILTNRLMNPTINYDINVREISASDAGLLKTRLNSEQEINRQMLGLLLFNQFLPTSSSSASVPSFDAGAGAGASASELLSNQVSNWLGQLSKDVSIGFNYRAADTYSKEEIQLLFSKSFINDRLTIEGNVGYLAEQTYTAGSTVVGDFYANYKLSKDGRLRLKGFNRSNADNIINYSQAPYTQGMGFVYRKEFNTFGDLFARWRKKNKEAVKAEKFLD